MKRIGFRITAMVLLCMLMFTVISCDDDESDDMVEGSFIIDSRDGQVYNIVEIGNQFWLERNMNYPVENSWCYDDDTENCNVYGRLYDWESANLACPTGWKLPSSEEWLELVNFLGGFDAAGGPLKSTSDLWVEPNSGANNGSGFTAFPGGAKVGVTGVYLEIGEFTGFWSSTWDMINNGAFAFGLYSLNDNAVEGFDQPNSTGYSCRCIMEP